MTTSLVLALDLALALITLVIMLIAFGRNRQQRGINSFVALGCSILGWVISELLFLSSSSAEQARLFFDMKLPFVSLMAVFLLQFTLSYYRLDRWATGRVRLLFFIIPLVTAILALTGGGHSLLRLRLEITLTQPLYTVVNQQGPWYWVHAVYSYLLIMASFIIMLRQCVAIPKGYRFSSGLMLAGISVSLASNVLGITLLRNMGFDITLPGMCATYGIILIALISGDSTDFLLLVRREIFNYIEDCIFVLDNKNRVMDANEAAKDWMAAVGISADAPTFQEISGKMTAAGEGFEELNTDDVRIYLVQTSEISVYQMRERKVFNGRGRQMGRFITLTDVTRYRMLIDRMEQTMGIDPLTGLSNRYRYEQRAGELDFLQDQCFSVVVGDVNELKYVNDTYGHTHGDRLLQACARVLIEVFGGWGQVFRIGGDEFAALLPGVEEEQANSLAEEVGRRIEQITGLKTTPSMALGVGFRSSDQLSFDEVFRMADLNMYAAKNKDRRKGPADRRRTEDRRRKPQTGEGDGRRGDAKTESEE